MPEKNLTFAFGLVLAFGAGVFATLFLSKKKTTKNVDVDANYKSVETVEPSKAADTNLEESKVESKVDSNIESAQSTDKDEEEEEEYNRTIEALPTTRINLTLAACTQTAKKLLRTQPGAEVSTLCIVYGKNWFRKFKDQYYSLVAYKGTKHCTDNVPLHIIIDTDSEIADFDGISEDHHQYHDQILATAHILMNHRGFKTVTCSKNYCTGTSFLLIMACDRFISDEDHFANNNYNDERKDTWPTYQRFKTKQIDNVRDFFRQLAKKNGLKNLEAYYEYFCDANSCWSNYFDKDTIPSFFTILANI